MHEHQLSAHCMPGGEEPTVSRNTLLAAIGLGAQGLAPEHAQWLCDLEQAT